MKIIDNPQCIACNEMDTLQHFFFGCNYVKNFWMDTFNWLNANLHLNIRPQEKDVIFGMEGQCDKISVINYVMLHAKFFIHQRRILDNHTLRLCEFKSVLKYNLQLNNV